jgi:hypothetical protein
VAVVVAILALLLYSPQKLWLLVIFLLPIQAASVVDFNVGARQTGVTPAELTMLVTCLWEIFSASGVRRANRAYAVLRSFRPAIFFLVYSILLTLLSPQIFSGRLLITLPQDFRVQTLLEPTASNLIHAGHLLLCVLSAVLLAARIGTGKQNFVSSIYRVQIRASAIALFLLCWQGAALYLDVWYPFEFLHNNPGVVHLEDGVIRPELQLNLGIRRIAGSFSEPSMAAVYFGCYCAFFLACALYHRRSGRFLWPVLAMGGGLFATGATTGFVIIGGLAVACCGLLVRGLFDRSRVRLTKRVLVLSLACGLVGVLSLAALWKVSQRDIEVAADLLVFNKISEDAHQVNGRSAVEMRALGVFLDSWGVGAGLGSNLSFTTIGYIVSNTGVIGSTAFFFFVYGLMRLNTSSRARRSNAVVNALQRGSALQLFVLLIMALSSVQWLLMPIAWIVIGTFVGSSTSCREQNDSEVERRQVFQLAVSQGVAV